ncbi:MAG: ABC transporter ATP-binding protein, partial [Clostridia bacterium]|nr:ABC transporter ATP-binding protein [Clostridia bacterium]
TKVYRSAAGEVRVLDGVDLTILPAEMVAVVGPSGSGKSTLLHVLGCLDRPTSGTYRLAGQPVDRLSDDGLAALRNRYLGFVFQSFHLLPRLTALENVELPLVYRGVPARERRRRAVSQLEAVGLGHRLQHRPTELSGGQQQRVAIARALVGEPAVILADEPTGSLDSRSGEEIVGLFEALNDRGLTVVIVTHDPQVAARCRRIVRIHEGRVVGDERAAGVAAGRGGAR